MMISVLISTNYTCVKSSHLLGLNTPFKENGPATLQEGLIQSKLSKMHLIQTKDLNLTLMISGLTIHNSDFLLLKKQTLF